MHFIMAATAAAFTLAAGTTTVEVGPAVCGVLDGGKYLYADAYNTGALVRFNQATYLVLKRIHFTASPS